MEAGLFFGSGKVNRQSVTAEPDGESECPVALRLLEEYAAVLAQNIAVLGKQFEKTVSGAPDANRFDDLVIDATEQRKKTREAYLVHLRTHGCSPRITPGRHFA